MTRKETTNTFLEGMIMDLNPLVTPNSVMTSCLNGTLITYNGNENVLLNDMGNGRVETAYLPLGYVPLGTTELGGIIYIVSYNPETNKCLIGSFPSPERNITTDELGDNEVLLLCSNFYESSGMIKTPFLKLELCDRILNPGDKFLIYCGQSLNNKNISAIYPDNTNADKFPYYLKLNVVVILEDGKMNILNDTLTWTSPDASTIPYYIYQGTITKSDDGKLELDEYRELVNANYSVLDSKVCGKLGILAQLECIDSFDVAWDAIQDDNKNWDFYFYVNWSYNNKSASDKINLYNIGIILDLKGDNKYNPIPLEINDYPNELGTTTTDITKANNHLNTFYTPVYCPDIESRDEVYTETTRIARRNDGSDNQFLIKDPYKTNKNSGTITLDIYPGMPYGYLSYLKKSFTINLDNLGSGEIDLVEYKYFWESKNITLNWALEAYPERNKRINDVSFSFYKFNDIVYNWINTNKLYIDTLKLVDGKWGETASGTPISAVPDYLFSTSLKGSYSGHFQENIQNLEDNLLYLVEISIDYNGNIIRYYRFMYTSEIFNSYYFTENDYSNILLEDNLKIDYRALDFLFLNLLGELKLLDENGELDKIPYYLGTETATNNYTILDTLEGDIRFLAIAENDIFNVKFNNLTVTKNTSEINTVNASKLCLTNGNLSEADIEDFDIVTSYSPDNAKFDDNNIFTEKATYTLNTPLNVNYDKDGTFPIKYIMSLLEIKDVYLLVAGKDKTITMYVTDDYCYRDVADCKDEYPDNSRKALTLSQYGNCYNELKSRLSNCDILAIKFKVHENSKDANGTGSVWGSGYLKLTKSDIASFELKYSYKGTNLALLIAYAMLDTNDNILLYTFGIDANKKWYGKNRPNTTTNTWADSLSPLAFKKSDVTTDFLKNPFSKYYKLKETGESKKVKLWKYIYYYNNYKWSTDLNIECNSKIILTLNDVEIKDSNLPNNLTYNLDKSFTFSENIIGKCNFDKYIEQVTSFGVDYQLVKFPDEDVLEMPNADPKVIYNGNHEKTYYLYKDDGTGTQLGITKHEIACSEGRFVFNPYSTGKTVMLGGKEEELSLTITNVYFT